jgi:hypothetical protein
MSWVAELNAISQKMASVAWKNPGSGMVNATLASAAPTRNCMVMIQSRLVRNMSTTGLQSGLITHGR